MIHRWLGFAYEMCYLFIDIHNPNSLLNPFDSVMNRGQAGKNLQNRICKTVKDNNQRTRG